MYCLFRLAYHRKSYIVIDAARTHRSIGSGKRLRRAAMPAGLYSSPRDHSSVCTPHAIARAASDSHVAG